MAKLTTAEFIEAIKELSVLELNDLVKDCLAAYDKFDFTTVFKKVFNFVSNDLSAFYLDFARISIFQQFELELYHFGFGNLVVKVISFTSSHSII